MLYGRAAYSGKTVVPAVTHSTTCPCSCPKNLLLDLTRHRNCCTIQVQSPAVDDIHCESR